MLTSLWRTAFDGLLFESLEVPSHLSVSGSQLSGQHKLRLRLLLPLASVKGRLPWRLVGQQHTQNCRSSRPGKIVCTAVSQIRWSSL